MTYIERLFAVFFTIAGLAFVFIVPPFQNPDEPMHFYRSYQLTKGHLSAYKEGELYGGEIPVSMRAMVVKAGIEHNYDFNYRFDSNYKDLLQYHYGGEKVFEGFPNTAIYTPLAYLPAMVAHAVTALFNGPLLVAMYLGRLFSMGVVLLAVIVALRTMPFAKWLIFAVMLLPMAVASSASVSADAMTMAVSVLLIAVTLRIAFSGKIVSRYWLIFLIGLAVCIGLVKQAHVALLPILFMIPLFNKAYRTRKMYWLFGITFAAALLLFAVWYLKTDQIVINFHPLVDPVSQKAYILHKPWMFVWAMLQTFFTTHGNGILISLFGNFGWLTAQLPVLFIAISTLALYWSTRVSGSDEKILTELSPRYKKWLNLYSIGLFLLVVTLISVALYLYWTPYKHSFIMGIQGRYFIPMLPLLLLPFVASHRKSSKFAQQRVAIATLTVLIAGVVTTYARFYIPPVI